MSEGAADDGEAREYQDKGKPNMSQGEDGPIGDTLSELARLAEMIGHQDRMSQNELGFSIIRICLPVPRHLPLPTREWHKHLSNLPKLRP